MRDLTTLDTSPSAQHRRLQTARRVLKEHDARGGRGISSSRLHNPDVPEDEKHRVRMNLAAAAYREEKRRAERLKRRSAA